jgi:hypothetical protein
MRYQAGRRARPGYACTLAEPPGRSDMRLAWRVLINASSPDHTCGHRYAIMGRLIESRPD